MSRIGKLEIKIPQGVEVKFQDRTLKVKGPKGQLEQPVLDGIDFNFSDSTIQVIKQQDSKKHRSLWGLYRSLLFNMVTGVSTGFSRSLSIKGTGYRAEMKGKQLNLKVGYSHDVLLDVPAGVECEVEKNLTIKLSGIDKAVVGQFAANIRRVRPVEPYKGKGIMYSDEYVRRKEGKSAK
jgi:large subunit ribosomal protein L6